MNRSEINRALAKCLAFLACGKIEQASEWGRVLVQLLTEAGCKF
jgi:hypothetical protein